MKEKLQEINCCGNCFYYMDKDSFHTCSYHNILANKVYNKCSNWKKKEEIDNGKITLKITRKAWEEHLEKNSRKKYRYEFTGEGWSLIPIIYEKE